MGQLAAFCQPSADKISTAALRPLSRNRAGRGTRVGQPIAGRGRRAIGRPARPRPANGVIGAHIGQGECCREPSWRRRALCGGKIRADTCGAALSLAGGPPRLLFTFVLLDFGSPSSTPRRPRPQASSVLSPSSQAPPSQDVRSPARRLCCESPVSRWLNGRALISSFGRAMHFLFGSSPPSRMRSRPRRRQLRRPLSGTSPSVVTPRPTEVWSSSRRR